MIPHQLILRNFLSYQDTAELDLRGLHLACISGLNGAGKSTILDGITWALFGKSRTKSDDDVVNRVAGEKGEAAEVVFIFELEGALYRIIRRKAPGKTAELEFHVRSVDAGTIDRWKVMTEARLRDTQWEIEKLLRMNYDIFTNASFLLQGKADEFTTKTPDRRKEILADILGVNQWDEYKTQVADQRKTVEAEVTLVDRQLTDVAQELAEEEERRLALDKALAEEKLAVAERDRQETLVASARQSKAQADQLREMQQRVIADQAGSEQELQRVERAAAERRETLAGYRHLIDRRAEIESAFAEWQAVDAEFAGWQTRMENYSQIRQELHPLELAIARTQSQLEQRQRELERQSNQAAAAETERQSLLGRLEEMKTQREGMATRLVELAEKEKDWQAARDQLQAIEYRRKLGRQELVQLQTRAEQIASWTRERVQLEESRRSTQALLDKTRQNLAELAEKQEQRYEKSNLLGKLEAENEQLRIAMNEKELRIRQLRQEETQDCPLCGQPLTTEHRLVVLEGLEREGSEQGIRYRQNQSQIQSLREEIALFEKAFRQQPTLENEQSQHQGVVARLEARLRTLDDELAAWSSGDEAARLRELEEMLADDSEENILREQVESLKTAAGEARRLNQEINNLDARIARDEARAEQLGHTVDLWQKEGLPSLEAVRLQLERGTYAESERDRLAEVKARLSAVGYDPGAHDLVRKRRSELRDVPRQHAELLQADAAVGPLAEGLAELNRNRDHLVDQIAGLRLQREEMTRQLQDLEAGIGDLKSAESELQQLRERVVAASRATGGARQRVEVLQVRRQDQVRMRETREKLTRRVMMLRQLEEACGRKGVQALLIEVALPEIEEYANDLLYRLTGGEMRVAFDTQRAAKTRHDTQIETLDIKISDSSGIRPYENYSGGEKFRVNFAIRLALSQVLARRAGARLQTLVIDEGFGSQDPEGRQRLVEAINTVQDEFACVLVITHIDELRDKFPARIDVEKTPAGSRLSVVTV